jgi:hypothetical protein
MIANPVMPREKLMLTIDPDTVCFIIIKAREFDVKEAPSDLDSGSNPTDDSVVDVLEDLPDDPTLQELHGTLAALNEDELFDLVALMWIGREDFTATEWAEARTHARNHAVQPVARYLLGTPMLGDYLEEGLAAMGYSCRDTERQHL